MEILKTTLLFLIVFIFSNHSKAQNVETQPNVIRPLEQFVGYYDVGVKPNRPSFRSKWYLRDGKLYTIYDSDKDRLFEPYENGRVKPTVFFSEKEVNIVEKDSTYYVVLNFEKDQLKSFRIIRPRNEWSTDLYGYRNKKLSKLAIDTEKPLTCTHFTTHFQFYYTKIDSTIIGPMGEHLEEKYSSLLKDFAIEKLPRTTIRVYPDLKTYHNAVLTPGAANWQMGRAWNNDQIRMLSPIIAGQIRSEDIQVNEIVLHEFVHCIHLNVLEEGANAPGWLWEGLAMYKGCCKWSEPNELKYIKNKKYPSIKQIERDRSYKMKYDLGYHIIEFLDHEYGWGKVLRLIHTNGDIKKALNISSREFEKQFYKYLEDN